MVPYLDNKWNIINKIKMFKNKKQQKIRQAKI